MKQHQLITDLFNTLLSCGYEGTIINEVSQGEHLISITILLPYHKEIADFEALLPNLIQELTCTDAKITNRLGKQVTILFGKRSLENITFNPSYLHPNTLKIELPSAFGSCILDFADGFSCHLLNGGTTRMGKTVFLLYIATTLYLQTSGQLDLYITSTKAKDFYPFQSLHNANITRTEAEFLVTLTHLIQEYHDRDQLLYSPSLQKATDAASVKSLYPEHYHLFKPIFILIDEYARFADNKEIQKQVTELVETAGYVNIHVIITSQRPDARTVLPPRIKGNLLARICFTTADEANSIVILDKPGAESLGRIPGRAILSDGELNTVQIPYITAAEAEELLTPYKKEKDKHENSKPSPNQNEPGYTNHAITSKIQDMFTQSNSSNLFQTEQQPDKCMQSNDETTLNGWFRLASPTTKG